MLARHQAVAAGFQNIIDGAGVKARYLKGLHKVRALLSKERIFLETASSHMSSNVPFFELLLRTLRVERGVVAVYETCVTPRTCRADIRSDFGQTWIKVRATQISALNAEYAAHLLENASSDDEDASNKASDAATHSYLLCKQMALLKAAASTSTLNYRTPHVVLQLQTRSGETIADIDNRLLATLSSLEVVVRIIDVASGCISDQTLDTRQRPTQSTFVNLDITTLISLATNLVHSGFSIDIESVTNPPFRVQILNEQEQPLLKTLLEQFNDKQLVVTEFALIKFSQIVERIAGPDEKARSKSMFNINDLERLGIESKFGPATTAPFMDKIQVVKDNPSDLYLRSKLDEQHLIVFGTGDSLKATTCSSNLQKISSIREMGLDVSCFEHSPRSFIEMRIINKCM